ncbi:MAG: ABC-type transport auxiliary lipoprotein family protein [Caulobacteraceae bacterium]
MRGSFSAVSQVRRAFAPAIALAALSLGGCVSLLPTAKPVQLYQFGQDSGAAMASPATVVARGSSGVSGVVLSGVVLPRAALGDGILTITGDEAAYVEGARWLAPAVLMFQEDVQRTFEGRAQRTRILDRGAVGVADALLRLDVGHFEARYDNGPAAPPTVLLTVRATLTAADGKQALQRVFNHREPVADNRVSLIVAAYDKAVDETLAEVVDWTDASAPGLGPTGAPRSRSLSQSPSETQ